MVDRLLPPGSTPFARSKYRADWELGLGNMLLISVRAFDRAGYGYVHSSTKLRVRKDEGDRADD